MQIIRRQSRRFRSALDASSTVFANRGLSQRLWTGCYKARGSPCGCTCRSFARSLHGCSAVFGKAFQVGTLRKRPRDECVSPHVELPRPDPEAAKAPNPDTLRFVVVRLLASATKCPSSASLLGSGRRIPSHRNEAFAAVALEDRRPTGA